MQGIIEMGRYALRITALFILLASAFGCARSTRSIEPVRGFDVHRYSGKWYEIARFPHSFEKGLTHVTAEYGLEKNGTISVLNKGYDPQKQKWKSARASARFSGPKDMGLLSVTFFKPFSAPYKIIHLDKESYQYALLTSSSYKYLWILSRAPTMKRETLDSLIQKATSYGFDVTKLLLVEQGKNSEKD